MLVLSRKVGQEIIIGDNIRITVNKISGNRVTLGIEAPDHVRILRGELEPIVHAFDESDDGEAGQNIPDVFAQTVGLVRDELAGNTIPFVPGVAR